MSKAAQRREANIRKYRTRVAQEKSAQKYKQKEVKMNRLKSLFQSAKNRFYRLMIGTWQGALVGFKALISMIHLGAIAALVGFGFGYGFVTAFVLFKTINGG